MRRDRFCGMKRRIMAVALAFAVLLAMAPGVGSLSENVSAEGSVYSGGSGTEADPYQISTAEQLAALAAAVNGGADQWGVYYKLMNDIDLGGIDAGGNGIGGKEWTPIGTCDSTGWGESFKGTFDGGGHTVSGLYINAPFGEYQGLFSNLVYGTIKNLGVDGAVSGTSVVGGVCGLNSNGKITNCYNTGAVSGGYMVGGVCGENLYGTITNCYNTGAVSGGNQVGGVCGLNSNGKITNCYNTGAVSGSSYVGGVCGENGGGTITNCYYLQTESINASLNAVAGGTGSATVCEDKTATEFASAGTFTSWDFTSEWVMDTLYGRPILRAIPEPHRISNLAELEGFRDHVNAGNNCAGMVFRVTADIDMSGTYGAGKGDGGADKSWTPIGSDKDHPFQGAFDGGGHTVSGLYAFGSEYQGLFGYLGEGGAIQNLGVDGVVSGNYQVGGVCGYSKGSITSCYNAGSVSGSYLVGGVCGYSEGSITSCYNTGTVSSSNTAGGVCGKNGGIIENCYNTGAVSGGNRDAGGVCGENHGGKIENCYNTGAVSGTSDVGGVCGENSSNSTITKCYNTGTVSGTSAVGGVCGLNSNGDSITNCYNTGAVNGISDVGGVCGENLSGTITSCYNTNAVRGQSNVGGVCGVNTGGTITSCYYNKEIYTAEDATTGVTGISAADFAKQATFADWDFATVWTLTADNSSLSRLILQSNPEAVPPVQPSDPSEEPTDPTDPSVQPSDPSEEPTDPTDPSVQPPYIPPVQPTDPSTDPTDPSDPSEDPSDPSTDPAEPSEDPTDPATDPSDPSAEDPTSPSTDPSDSTGGTSSATTGTTTAASAKKPFFGTSVKWKGASITLSWTKVTGADGYDVYAIQCGKDMSQKTLNKTIKGSKTSATLTKIGGKTISAKKTYKIRIRAWKYVGKKKVYMRSTLTAHMVGASNKTYTNAKKLTSAKSSYTLKKGKSATLRIKTTKQSAKKKLLSTKHCAYIRYYSDNTKIAAVTSKGKVTAKAKGTCYVYAVAQNGVRTKVKVTVK